jgi:hypothetical protein
MRRRICLLLTLQCSFSKYIHIHIQRGSRGISDIPLRHPCFTKISYEEQTADVTGGKSIAVLVQSISGVSAINILVAFCDTHGGKREVLLLYFVPDTTRDNSKCYYNSTIKITKCTFLFYHF